MSAGAAPFTTYRIEAVDLYNANLTKAAQEAEHVGRPWQAGRVITSTQPMAAEYVAIEDTIGFAWGNVADGPDEWVDLPLDQDGDVENAIFTAIASWLAKRPVDDRFTTIMRQVGEIRDRLNALNDELLHLANIDIGANARISTLRARTALMEAALKTVEAGESLHRAEAHHAQRVDPHTAHLRQHGDDAAYRELGRF